MKLVLLWVKNSQIAAIFYDFTQRIFIEKRLVDVA